jgi:uncharacterized protein
VKLTSQISKMLIERTIQHTIEQNLFKGKVILLYGARRVGKTTLSRQLLDKYNPSKYINCELLQNKTALETTNSELLRDFIGTQRLVVLDEAQYIQDIGRILKILVDTFPDVQIIATGSSSFDLSNRVNEPLTGRSRQFLLLPFSIGEIQQQYSKVDISAKLGQILRFGLYPDVFAQTNEDSIEELNNIASNYLYKDVLQFENLKRTDLVFNLLRALALQIGKECSLNELSRMLGVNVHTIKRYITLFEKAFVIFRLNSFSRNLRNEIGKSQKIYFYDLGIRNSLIQNYNDLETRNDVGELWENFCVLERMKANNNKRHFVNMYFWRTYDQKEIDYIEEANGKLYAFEFKYSSSKKNKNSALFMETYPESEFSTVNSSNFFTFLQA